ncbi:MAG: nitrate/nitrite transporter [Halanaeroarchaeum sp.]
MTDGRPVAEDVGEPPFALRLVPHALVASMGYVVFVVAGLPDLLTARLDIGLAAFGLLTSAPLGAFVLSQPIASWLADRYPTTRILLWTAAIHVVLAVLLDLPRTFEVLVGLRTLWGMVAGLVLSVGATHVARLRRGGAGTLEQGIFGGMLTLGGAVGFLLGGPVVAATGGFGLHAAGVVPGLLALAIAWRYRSDERTAPAAVPDASDVDGDQSSATDTLASTTNPTVLLAAVVYVAIIGSYVTLSTFITAFFDDLGIPGPVNALVLLGATFGRVAGGVSVWRFPIDDVGLIGWSTLVAAGGFLALSLGPGNTLLIVLPFVVMIALSVPFGAVYNVAAGATGAEGTALATVVAAGNIGALVLPPIAGAVRAATGDYASAFVLLAALNGIAVLSAVAMAGEGVTDRIIPSKT